jgi:protein-disulfide isomerase
MTKINHSILPLTALERDHIQGESSAPLTLIEYGDYECPHCAHAHPIVKEIQKTLGKDLCFVFRNFPLTEVHPHAELAAEAAEAAAAQGKFWPMHDAIFEHQPRLSLPLMQKLAVELALDPSLFAADLENRSFKDRIHEDFMSGVRHGVNGTPSFFINGERFNGPVELLLERLQSLV